MTPEEQIRKAVTSALARAICNVCNGGCGEGCSCQSYADAAIAAYLKALEAAGPWTPIGTPPAPRQICIFAWHQPGRAHEAGITIIDKLMWPEGGIWPEGKWSPTHWMPFVHPKSETPR